MNELWAVGLAGAAVGGALGWPMLRRRDDGESGVRLLGWLLLLGGLAAGLIAARHGGLLPEVLEEFGAHVTNAGNVVFWPMLVIWARAEMRRGTPMAVRAAIVAVPLAAYLAGAVATREVVPFVWLLPVGTAASAHLLFLRVRTPRRHDVRGALLDRMIAAAVALSLAQAVRTCFPDIDALREIVPLTMTAGFLSIAALSVRMMFAEAPPASPGAVQRYARSALDQPTAQRLLLTLDRGMADGAWYREPTLSLVEIAKRLDTRPHLISQALNQMKGVTLNDYLVSWRLGAARRLLADPGSDRFTVDALAESAGFASRSAFYKAFKAHEGITPTEFRARARASAPAPEAGM